MDHFFQHISVRCWLACLACAVLVAQAEGQDVKTLPEEKHSITGVAFSSDGKKLATVSDGGPVRIWDVATEKQLEAIEVKVPAYSVAFSPDGKLLAYGVKGGRVHLRDVAAGKEIYVIENVGDYVPAVAFSPDGHFLTFAVRRKVGLYDLRGKSPKFLLSGHLGDSVNGVAFSLDSKQVASASRDDDAFRLWDVTPHGLSAVRVLRRSTTEAWAVAFVKGGKKLVAGDGFDVLLMDIAREETKVTKLGSHGGGNADVRKVAVSPDGKLAASAAVSDGYRVWDLEASKLVVHLKEAGGFTVNFSPDGKWLATGGGKGVVKIWDVSELLRKK